MLGGLGEDVRVPMRTHVCLCVSDLNLCESNSLFCPQSNFIYITASEGRPGARSLP